MDKEDRPLEPTLNEAASQWRLHNGTELDECRTPKPRDKGHAESLVNQTYSRREQYEREERSYMRPLPPKPFRLKYAKEITINSIYHFLVDKNHFYSVPYQHIGKKAKVIYNAETVRSGLAWAELQLTTGSTPTDTRQLKRKCSRSI